MFINIFILAIILLHSTTTAARKSSKIKYDKPGPHKIKSIEFPQLKDSSRENRPVPLKIHFPVEGENFPLVIMSHGGCGTYDSNILQSQHLASHGYVVLCAEHVYSNRGRMRFLMSRKGGRLKFRDALFEISKDPESALERPKDISFAIDRAAKWNSDNKDLKGKIDTKKIAAIGHSYGAYTTLVACGARPLLDYFEFPSGKERKGLSEDLSDPRIIFGMAMSPQGPGTCFSKESYKTINRPLICLSGTKDYQLSYYRKKKLMKAQTRLEFFEYLPDGCKFFLWLKNGDHMGFSDNPKAKEIIQSKAKTDMQRISKAVMVLSCDYFLKDKKDAFEKMNEEYLNSLCGKVVANIKLFKK